MKIKSTNFRKMKKKLHSRPRRIYSYHLLFLWSSIFTHSIHSFGGCNHPFQIVKRFFFLLLNWPTLFTIVPYNTVCVFVFTFIKCWRFSFGWNHLAELTSTFVIYVFCLLIWMIAMLYLRNLISMFTMAAGLSSSLSCVHNWNLHILKNVNPLHLIRRKPSTCNILIFP